MKKFGLCLLILCSLFLLTGQDQAAARLAYDAAFDTDKMGDMSAYDPNNPVIPTGDTIKIALVVSFSGPAATVGELYWIALYWVAYDINQRGGIYVDGKKKMVQLFRADHQSKPQVTKQVSERMVLQEKVQFLWGTNGSNNQKVINEVADQYKVIAQDDAALSDELYDATNFTRYSFMTTVSCAQVGTGIAYYYGKIRKKERKFYVLCQDYLFGHSMAKGFVYGIKKYYPGAKIVGEDYHKLFATDYAPFLEKIKSSGAEVIYTGDWIPDAANLVKQTRAMGIKLPMANLFLNDSNFLSEVGVEGTKNLIHFQWFGSEGKYFKNKKQIKYFMMWNNLYKTKWSNPYNKPRYMYPLDTMGSYIQHFYWLMSVIERAKSTDPEKIIQIWEGDRYKDVNGTILKIRPFDHKVIQDTYVEIYLPPDQQKGSMNVAPYYWFNTNCYVGKTYKIPARFNLPPMDRKIKRSAADLKRLNRMPGRGMQ
jgi:branched-chain amino acid transport system substrate-binding protein